MITDYHCHTRWCKHADGEIEDYIKIAIERNVDKLAITDHVPHIDDIDKRRLGWKEFDEYNKELDSMIIKYKNEIEVIKGFECEYYPEYMQTYADFKQKYNYKIMVLGHHTSCDRKIDNFATKGHEHMLLYSHEVCEALNTNFFTYLAHVDVPLSGYKHGFDDVAKKAFGNIFAVCEKLNIPVEYNANGVRDKRQYPNMEVYNYSKQFNLRYIVNSDAHSPQHIRDYAVINSVKELKAQGFNLIDSL